MNLTSPIAVWTPFVIASLLTVLVYTTSWAIGPYWVLLSLLGALSAGLAIKVLAHTGLKLWAVACVIAGLAVGQWWLIELSAMQLFWAARGFAP